MLREAKSGNSKRIGDVSHDESPREDFSAHPDRRSSRLMSNQGIARRIMTAIEEFEKSDYEASLLHVFPALDATAKKRRPKDAVGARFYAFVRDEEALITAIASRSVLKDVLVDGVSLPDALYKFARNPLIHDAALDERIRFNEDGRLQIGAGTWDLPSSFILAMIVAVVTAAENGDQRTRTALNISIHGRSFRLALLWGRPDLVRRHMEAVFGQPGLFD